jgi:hypothetical protein
VVAEAAVLGVDLVALGCWFGHFGIVLCLLIVECLLVTAITIAVL